MLNGDTGENLMLFCVLVKLCVFVTVQCIVFTLLPPVEPLRAECPIMAECKYWDICGQ